VVILADVFWGEAARPTRQADTADSSLAKAETGKSGKCEGEERCFSAIRTGIMGTGDVLKILFSS